MEHRPTQRALILKGSKNTPAILNSGMYTPFQFSILKVLHILIF